MVSAAAGNCGRSLAAISRDLQRCKQWSDRLVPISSGGSLRHPVFDLIARDKSGGISARRATTGSAAQEVGVLGSRLSRHAPERLLQRIHLAQDRDAKLRVFRSGCLLNPEGAGADIAPPGHEADGPQLVAAASPGLPGRYSGRPAQR